MPACCQAQVAKRAHHSSQGPYGLQYVPWVSGSGKIWEAAAATMAAEPGNVPRAVAEEKLYVQASGSSSQYPVPWLLPMMAEICVAVGFSARPP